MAYREEAAERIRQVLKRRKGFREQKMFGGIAFMHNGNMCGGVMGDKLVLRLGKEGADAALKEPFTSPMDFTGKVLATMVYVSSDGFETDEDLKEWIDRAHKFTKTLPAK